MKFGLREIIFIVVLMAIPVGAWWFVFNPQSQRNAEMRKEIEARQAKLEKLNKYLVVMPNLQKQIAEIDRAIEFFQSKLPSEKEMEKTLQDIWMLAEQNDLQAKGVRRVVAKPGASYVSGETQAEQPINVQLQGDFKGFYSFLLALENQQRIMRISRMTLIRMAKDASSGGEITIDFDMSIFFEKNTKEQPWPQKT